MSGEELNRARTALRRLIERSTRDAADLRQRGVAAPGAVAVEAVVETAKRIDDILRRVKPKESTTWSRHDADESDLDDARGGE